MVDYSALRKKFPVKDPKRRKKLAAIKAIAREYEAKRAYERLSKKGNA